MSTHKSIARQINGSGDMAKQPAKRTAGLFAVAVVLMACAGSERSAESVEFRTVIDTLADVIYVRNQGIPPEWSLIEVATLGRKAGESAASSDQEFGFITGVIADSAGQIYVADAQAAEIRVFDENGQLIRRIGRRGSGPAEFLALMSIGWITGDLLAVLDPGNGRLGIMSRMGEWSDQRQFMGMDGVRLHSAGGDDIYMPIMRITGTRRELAYVRQGRSAPLDTLTNAPVVPSDEWSVQCTYRGGQIVGLRRAAFAPEFLRIPAPGLVWASARSADYRIVFTTPRGDTLLVVERDIGRRSVDDAAWQEQTAAFNAFLQENPDAQCEQRELPKPDAMRLFRLVFFDDHGRMWVEREAAAGLILDSFDSAGRLLGQVSIPDRSLRVPPFILNDKLYMVVTDELDTQSVKVFRIVGMN